MHVNDFGKMKILIIQLEAGQFFGELTPTKQQSTVKLSYPSYSAKGLCTLLRLTSFNYERVIEVK